MSLPLVESLQHDAVSREPDIDAVIPVPDGGLTTYRRAVSLVLGKERDAQVETTTTSRPPPKKTRRGRIGVHATHRVGCGRQNTDAPYPNPMEEKWH
jgi:hypothetical protein